MAYSATISEVVIAGGRNVTTTNILTGSSYQGIDEEVADSETNKEIIFTLDYSAATLFYVNSTQNVTFETNDGEAPANTLNLLANIPYIWYTGKYDTLKITTDITKVFITNASGSTATIRIEAITDATP